MTATTADITTPAERRAARARDMRLRRAAERQRLRLTRSRRRDPLAVDYMGHWLIDIDTGETVYGGICGATLDQIEAYLTTPRDER